jgi:hypothetical protein
MKFISKTNNLHIILRPGISEQPLTGTPARAAISVRFQDGVANVEQDELVEMMMRHPGFNIDYIAADEAGTDPYAYLRQDSEPAHVITEMRYGQPENRTASPVKRQLPPEIRKMVQEQATEIAKQMLPSMVEEALKTIVSSRAQDEAPAPEGVEEGSAAPQEPPKAGTETPKPKGRPKKETTKTE